MAKKTKKKKSPKVGRVVIKKKPQTRKKIVEDIYDQYLTYYYDSGYKGKDLNTSSRGYNWGLGIEHEAQLFHISRNTSSFKNSNILFDTQESTCYLTHDKDKKGSCCKLIKGCYYDHPNVKKIMKKRIKLSKEDEEWLKKIPWEMTGRQFSGCEPSRILLKRTPTLMPEFITSNHKNRSIESIVEELLFIEKKFIDLQMKNPHTRQKVRKYGEIRTLPYGAVDNILVPLKPTMDLNEYMFYPEKYLDYVGSYHFTFTLPCPQNISDNEFVKIHQNFANQFQWIEPILIASLFSGDPRTITQEDFDKKIRGSFRILATGWGNLAGSDLRKIGTQGIDRLANIESVWRKGLEFKDTKKLMDCDKKVRSQRSVGILSSDIRTFGFDHTPNCKKKYRESECPKVSGAPVIYPNGIEFRIFDHFNSKYLLDTMRLMIYLAENSRNYNTKNFVYSNIPWKNALRNVMNNGWKAILSDSYLNELRKNLNLSLNLRDKSAFGFMRAVNDELFLKHRYGFYPTLMMEKVYPEAPTIPELNRFSWEVSFNDKYQTVMKTLMKNNFRKNQNITIYQFEKVLYTKFKKSIWSEYVDDILFALENRPYKMLELRYPSGKITSIKYIGN